MVKEYPRLRIYKVLPPCEHQHVDQPWRVQTVRFPGDQGGFVELYAQEFESARDHVAYKLSPKPPRQRLTLTLNKL